MIYDLSFIFVLFYFQRVFCFRNVSNFRWFGISLFNFQFSSSKFPIEKDRYRDKITRNFFFLNQNNTLFDTFNNNRVSEDIWSFNKLITSRRKKQIEKNFKVKTFTDSNSFGRNSLILRVKEQSDGRIDDCTKVIDPRLNTALIKAKNSLDANLDEVLPLIGGNSRRNRKCKALDDNCRRKGEGAVCIADGVGFAILLLR